MRDRTPATSGAADLLTIGFGTAVGMWAVGYMCRLFGDAVPPAVVFGLLIACLVVGGVFAGRATTRGARGGVFAGLLTGLLNLLLVGSLMSGQMPNEIKRGALLWVPGTLVVCAVVGGIGAGIGHALRRRTHIGRGGPTLPQRARRPHHPNGGRTLPDEPDWPGHFAAVAACATFVLLAAGGLVTGFDEGLAVVDWPNTAGYNMFLYPLARMTGGVYLEHAHRLLGSLVGLTTLVLACQVQLTARRRGAKALAWLALAMVIVQGILGGLRVTGRFTFSTHPEDTDPNTILAIVHGVFGQLVFAALVALAVVRTRRWGDEARGDPRLALSANTDRVFGAALVVALVVQLVLGALVRHFSWALDVLRYGLKTDPARLVAIGQHMLTIHITFAVIVAVLAVAVGVRAWGIYRSVSTVRRLGCGLLWLVLVQVALGVTALVATGNNAVERRPTAIDVAITTAHQMVGAAMLACAAALAMWVYHLSSRVDAGPAPGRVAEAD
jgi:cytochrome c oxidase assembly protein subunit 15